MQNEYLSDLTALSAKLGSDITLVQGNNGSISIKTDDDCLWVTGANTKLAEAASKSIFTSLKLSEVQKAVVYDQTAYEQLLDRHPQYPLKASIDAGLHAVMPHRCVIFVHSVNALAWSVQPDGLQRVLDGLRWSHIPFAHRGVDLAAMLTSHANMYGMSDVLILSNNGLAVGADTPGMAAQLLNDVERRLVLPADRMHAICAPAPELAECEEQYGWRLPKYAAVHLLGTDPANAEIVLGGTLYSNHVRHLGDAVISVPGHSLWSLPEPRKSQSKLCIVPGHGALIADYASAADDEMAYCLAAVSSRLSCWRAIDYLSQSDVDHLVSAS